MIAGQCGSQRTLPDTRIQYTIKCHTPMKQSLRWPRIPWLSPGLYTRAKCAVERNLLPE